MFPMQEKEEEALSLGASVGGKSHERGSRPCAARIEQRTTKCARHEGRLHVGEPGVGVDLGRRVNQ